MSDAELILCGFNKVNNLWVCSLMLGLVLSTSDKNNFLLESHYIEGEVKIDLKEARHLLTFLSED